MAKKKKDSIGGRIDKEFSMLSPDQRMFLKVQAQEKEAKKQQAKYEQERFNQTGTGRFIGRTTTLGTGLVRGLRQIGNLRGDTRPAPNLTREQSILGELFGGGEGAVLPGDGSSLPQINNQLIPGRNGDEETSSMFGFGSRSERSGLF